MRKYLVAICFASLAPLSSPLAEAAPPPSPVPSISASPAPAPTSIVDFAKSRLDTMLRTGHADPAWFSATFLAQVPASKVDAVLANVKSSLGEYRSVEFTPTQFVAHFAKGTDDVLLHLDIDNKIDGLFFQAPALGS